MHVFVDRKNHVHLDKIISTATELFWYVNSEDIKFISVIKMTSNVPTFGNKWLSILLVIVTLSKPSSMTEKPPTGYCEKYVNYKDYEEVCGTDGITYSNVYHLECINRHDKKDGE